MKKIFLILAISLLSTVSFATGDINPKVLDAFRKEFTGSQDVSWSERPDYYIAQFMYNGQPFKAYFNYQGELLGSLRHMTTAYLPVNLQISLKKYSRCWVTDLYEVSNRSNTFYFVTIENADQSIVLKASPGCDWIRYKKVDK